MPTTYAYKVRDRDGKVHSGSLDADNTALVANKLRQMGYVPISIDKKAGAGVKREIAIPGFSNRVKLKEIAVFSRQFATMIGSGLTLMRSLSILAVQTEQPVLRRRHRPDPQRHRIGIIALPGPVPASEAVQPAVRVDDPGG